MNKARLLILKALVLSLLITLGGRLYYLQILSGTKYSAAAKDNRVREISTPAARGSILDDQGRPLVRNRTAIVISVSHFDLVAQKDHGKAVLGRLAHLIGIDVGELTKTVTPCARGVPLPCWNGSPQQPVPVKHYEADDPTADRKVLEIEEHKDLYPAVTAELQAVRDYPNKTLAAHALGYLSPITQEELDKNVFPGATATDLVGHAGLEQEYNSYLAGKDGLKQLLVDRSERVTGTLGETPATAGDDLVLSIDENIQKDAEQALEYWVKNSRTRFDRDGKHYNAPAGAAVVLDAKTGRVLALAGYPTYDPSLFVGGISYKNYKALTSEANGYPMLDQSVLGQYAPGSTFKIVTTSAVVENGDANFGGSYSCPSTFTFGTGHFSNFEGEGLGTIGLHTALVKSCDTIFYKFAADEWLQDGGQKGNGHPKEPIATMAKAFGLNGRTGIDLPLEAPGRIADRAYKKALWEDQKHYYCTKAKTGFPEVKDAAFADYLKRLMSEDCDFGYLFLGGDAVIQAVGQGDTVVTPLGLAVAYEALANGGKLVQPLLAKAAINANGKVVKTFTPKVNGHIPVSPDLIAQITSGLVGVTSPSEGGTAAGAFAGFPLDRIPVAGKTGTAEVANKQDTSWFASFAPANDPQFVVVGMVAEAGQGALAAAPMVRQIYDGIYGTKPGTKAAAPDGKLAQLLPTVNPDGTVKAPADAPKQPNASTPAPHNSPSPSPGPSSAAFGVAGLGLTAVVRRQRGTRKGRLRS